KTGKVQHVVGSGIIGLKDGPFASSQFHQPQGMALTADGKTLYVADTENHAVREIDLAGHTVKTLAGTGKQSNEYEATGPADQNPRSSPWDLALVGRKLFVALAGTHQIGVIDLDRREFKVFAGTGREACISGPNEAAAFAQPSGLTSDGKILYVADAESSSI